MWCILGTRQRQRKASSLGLCAPETGDNALCFQGERSVPVGCLSLPVFHWVSFALQVNLYWLPDFFGFCLSTQNLQLQNCSLVKQPPWSLASDSAATTVHYVFISNKMWRKITHPQQNRLLTYIKLLTYIFFKMTQFTHIVHMFTLPLDLGPFHIQKQQMIHATSRQPASSQRSFPMLSIPLDSLSTRRLGGMEEMKYNLT